MRNLSEITKRDLEWKRLGGIIREVIKRPRDWRRFKSYMDFYYQKLPKHK